MAWIESHQDLKDHPKTCDLMAAMGWDLDTTIGKLHRLWWWCVDYAEDGDLRKHNDNRIANAMGVANADASKLIKSLVSSGWLDREPYFRVHDWWDYIGLFLQRKHGGKNPQKWQHIKDSYTTVGKLSDNCRDSAHELTQPNRTEPNQPNLTNTNKGSLYAEPMLKTMPLVEILSLCRRILGEEEMNRYHKRWLDRGSKQPRKLGRVISEVDNAAKEGRIKTTPAQYAEQIWKEFK
jgi:hypothetical protein